MSTTAIFSRSADVRLWDSLSRLGGAVRRRWMRPLLRTDLATRVKIYQAQRDIRLRTADEIRELEDLMPPSQE